MFSNFDYNSSSFMSKREERSKKETRAEFKEVKAMKSKLHEMLRFFGEGTSILNKSKLVV